MGLLLLVLGLPGVAAAQLEGRVVASGAEQTDVLVTLQRETGQIVHQAFTSSRGTFRLEGVTLFTISNNNPYYLVVELEGYKPYRRRLQQLDLRGGGSVMTIYLEPEARPLVPTVSDGDNPTVDVRQLEVEIPEEAFREREAGREESERGDFESAAEHFEKAVELAPDYYVAWIDLGGQYDRLDRIDDARFAYLEATEVNPAGVLALVNLGALYYQQAEREREAEDAGAFGTYSLAQEWLERAVDINPGSGEALFYLGATLYRLDRFAESEDMLKRALALQDGLRDAHLLLINVYTRQGRFSEALDQTSSFLATHPEAPERDAIERIQAQLEAALDR